MFLKNAWYQASWSEELAAGALLSRHFLGQPVVLFRDPANVAHALEDMCPHRFAPLSMGRLEGERIVCGYHGLAFEGSSGHCVHNPHGAQTAAMHVRHYPLVEKHHALWIWMGEADQADPALIPDLSFIDDVPDQGRVSGYMRMGANYLLLNDNILDLSHADYLHPTTLGGAMTGSKMTVEERDGTVFVNWWSADVYPPPFLSEAVPAGSRADIWTEVHWSAPAIMTLRTGAVPAGAPRPTVESGGALHSMTPEGPTSTHYFWNNSRTTNLEPGASAAFKAQIEHIFSTEDKPMLEAQQARMGDREFWSMRPALLSVDGPAVRARRRLAHLIAEEGRAANATVEVPVAEA